MSLRNLGLPIVLALGAAACATSSLEEVDYRVTGGFDGTGDGTSLHVTSDGTATKTTSAGGTVTEQLDAATFSDLKSKISAAQFPTLEPRYPCAGGCSDHYVYEISVELDDRTYEVKVDEFGAEPPAGLQALITTLQQIAEQRN